jgi:hypothetical protein
MILKNTLNEDYTYFCGSETIKFRAGEIKIVDESFRGKYPGFLVELGSTGELEEGQILLTE